jgi:hypothetical protein
MTCGRDFPTVLYTRCFRNEPGPVDYESTALPRCEGEGRLLRPGVGLDVYLYSADPLHVTDVTKGDDGHRE